MPGLRASQPSGLRSFRGVEQSLLRGGMQERDHRIPRGGQDPHEGRGSDDLRGPAARACPRLLVARRRPPERPAADNDVRGAVEPDERAVGELVEGELVQSPGRAVQALGVQARVDGVVACSGILGELPLDDLDVDSLPVGPSELLLPRNTNNSSPLPDRPLGGPFERDAIVYRDAPRVSAKIGAEKEGNHPGSSGKRPVDQSDVDRGREHPMRRRRQYALIALAALAGFVAVPGAAHAAPRASAPSGATCIVQGSA